MMRRGQYPLALLAYWNLPDSEALIQECWKHIMKRSTISAGGDHLIALAANGELLGSGKTDFLEELASWQRGRILSVDAGYRDSAILTEEHVVFAHEYTQDDYFERGDSVDAAVGTNCILMLNRDGTVSAWGPHPDLSSWREIIDIDVYGSTIYGLQADGTLLEAGAYFPSDSPIRLPASDLISVSATDSTIPSGSGYVPCAVGLRSDGTILTASDTVNEIVCAPEWNHIVSIDCADILQNEGDYWYSHNYIFALRSDGTLLSTDDEGNPCPYVSNWNNLAAFTCSGNLIAGVSRDGSVLLAGDNAHEQKEVPGWPPIQLP